MRDKRRTRVRSIFLLVAVPSLLLSLVQGSVSADRARPSSIGEQTRAAEIAPITGQPGAAEAYCGSREGQPVYTHRYNFVMDVKGGAGGRNIIVWPDHNGVNQNWVPEYVAGTFFLHACYDHRVCLDVEGARYQNGTRLIVHPCNGQDNQRFYTENAHNGYVFIHSAGNSSKCLNVEGGTAQGRRVILWSCDYVDNNFWYGV